MEMMYVRFSVVAIPTRFMSGARNSPFGVRTKLMLFYLPLSSRLRRRSSEGGLLGSDKSFRGELRQAPLRLGATGLGEREQQLVRTAKQSREQVSKTNM